MNPMIRGSIVALVTPFNQSLQVDFDAYEALLEWHIASGTHAIVAVGTSGESATLSVEEHLEVIRFTVDKVAGRVPVIAGTGGNSTHEAIHLTSAAKDLGVDACLVVTPYYNKPTQEGLYLHYKAIADAVDVPIILYNVPGRTAVDLLPETVVRLAELSNVIAIKEATGDVERGRWLVEHCGEKIDILSGDDATALELIRVGGKGDISVTANVAPAQMAEMCARAIAGELEIAESINTRLMPLHNGLFVESNPIPVKFALSEMGKIENIFRLPLTPLSQNFRQPLTEQLEQANIELVK